ncbi:MAG: sigma-70 family RNA polymerase sigma factor [Planctomycetes bacterium]|nr:sigma-70 family RNA polymerase sigma factor [Planctomycetota bacterium]
MADREPDELLADLQWLRGLARELADDVASADDAAQTATVQALSTAAVVQRPRAWLATVLRNVLRQDRRGQRARRRREAFAARPEAVAGADELVARAELQQQLVGHVLALAEPYRTTVLLRFFDELPPRAIATRMGVPVATVHSRLQRALQQLRQVLDRDCGGRAAWIGLLWSGAPLAVVPLPLLGVVCMQAKVKLLLAAVVVVSVLPFLWPGDDGAAPRVEAARERVVGGPDAGAGGSDGSAAPVAASARERIAPPGARDAEPAAETRVEATGVVYDGSGTRLPGVAVAKEGSREVLATSDAAGRFVARVRPGRCTFVAGDERYETVLAATWEPASRVETVLIVAEQLAVRGRVVDRQGAPVAGANVLFVSPPDLDSRFAVPLDRGDRQRWQAKAAADGTFALPRLPRLQGATLLASADTFLPVHTALPTERDAIVEIVLDKFRYEQGQLVGKVVDAGGSPVGGARVAMGLTSVVSEDDGTFALALRRAGWPTELVAAKAGHLPGRVDVPRGGGGKVADWPSPLVIRLGGPPLTIAGRVVDADGHGVPGAIVWVQDPTLLGIAGMLPVQLEYLIAGGEVPPLAARMRVPFADDPTVDEHFNDQTSVVENPTACWYFATADDDGAFNLGGLLPRSYALRALDVRTGIVGDATALAGTRQDIAITRLQVLPLLRATVVNGRGTPMADVQVEQFVRAFVADVRVPGGRFEGTALRRAGSTTTGADGTFELRNVGLASTTLTLEGDAILPMSVTVAEVANPTAATIRVEGRCHVEVILADPAEADNVQARDASGAIVDCAVLRRNSTSMTTDLALHAGRSGVFVLSERATVLLLRRGEATVRSVPLQLQPGQTTTIQ